MKIIILESLKIITNNKKGLARFEKRPMGTSKKVRRANENCGCTQRSQKNGRKNKFK